MSTHDSTGSFAPARSNSLALTWPALATTMLGCALLLALAGTAPRALLAALLLLVCGAGASAWITRRQRRLLDQALSQALADAQLQHQAASAEAAASGLQAVCLEAVPIWAKQVESSRHQTEQAIVALANRFSGIYTKLEDAVHASQQAAGDLAGDTQDGALIVLTQSESELSRVIDSLKTTQLSRDEMLAQVRTQNHGQRGGGDCRSDQPAGAQCRHRGRPCRRSRSRLRRGGRCRTHVVESLQ